MRMDGVMGGKLHLGSQEGYRYSGWDGWAVNPWASLIDWYWHGKAFYGVWNQPDEFILFLVMLHGSGMQVYTTQFSLVERLPNITNVKPS